MVSTAVSDGGSMADRCVVVALWVSVFMRGWTAMIARLG